MQIKITEENERLLAKVYHRYAQRAAEVKMSPPSVTQIVNGLIASYGKAYIDMCDSSEKLSTRDE